MIFAIKKPRILRGFWYFYNELVYILNQRQTIYNQFAVIVRAVAQAVSCIG